MFIYFQFFTFKLKASLLLKCRCIQSLNNQLNQDEQELSLKWPWLWKTRYHVSCFITAIKKMVNLLEIHAYTYWFFFNLFCSTLKFLLTFTSVTNLQRQVSSVYILMKMVIIITSNMSYYFINWILFISPNVDTRTCV